MQYYEVRDRWTWFVVQCARSMMELDIRFSALRVPNSCAFSSHLLSHLCSPSHNHHWLSRSFDNYSEKLILLNSYNCHGSNWCDKHFCSPEFVRISRFLPFLLINHLMPLFWQHLSSYQFSVSPIHISLHSYLLFHPLPVIIWSTICLWILIVFYFSLFSWEKEENFRKEFFFQTLIFTLDDLNNLLDREMIELNNLVSREGHVSKYDSSDNRVINWQATCLIIIKWLVAIRRLNILDRYNYPSLK